MCHAEPRSTRPERRGPCLCGRPRLQLEGAEGENYSAYVPDLPGCVATGTSREDVEAEMRDAIAFHIEGLREHGEPVPEPSPLTTAYVDVAA